MFTARIPAVLHGLALGALLVACSSVDERQGEPCPAVFPVPSLSLSPRVAQPGDAVVITVTTIKANEACYAYPVHRIDYLVNGHVIARDAVDNTNDGTFHHTWIVQAGQHGVPASGEGRAVVTAQAASDDMLIDAHPREGVEVRITSP